MIISISLTIFVIIIIAFVSGILLSDTINQSDKEDIALENEVHIYERKVYVNFNSILDKFKLYKYDKEDATILLTALKNQSESDRVRLINQVNSFDTDYGTYKFKKKRKKKLIGKINFIHEELLLKCGKFRENLIRNETK